MAAPMGESLGIPYDVIHMHACVHVYMYVGHPHHHIHPSPHLQGDPQNQ